jgi:Holliday junction resolvase RusA-like endonuclease
MAHSPKTTWFSIVYGEALKLANSGRFDCPLAVSTVFRFPRLKSGPKATRWKATRPDCDNLLKGTLDAVTQAGLWTDDGLVVRWSGEKRFVSEGERPGATIIISHPDMN